jgi:hypothetical protein
MRRSYPTRPIAGEGRQRVRAVKGLRIHEVVVNGDAPPESDLSRAEEVYDLLIAARPPMAPTARRAGAGRAGAARPTPA